MEDVIYKDALFTKSFYMLGDSLKYCYGCKYCRLGDEKEEDIHYNIIPSKLNKNFVNLPVSVNLFYGDPLLQIDNTIKYLKLLEKARHKGPVIIITKGDYSKFPDEKFDLDLHVAFSTFGIDSYLDGNTMERFENNLKCISTRKNNYNYSIEFRPIIYGINDSDKVFERVIKIASKYNLAIGYSGLQGKPKVKEEWEKEGLSFNAYPGYELGYKKIIGENEMCMFECIAKKYSVPIFRKTSCLISYVHGLERDYNAHYYRPTELNCSNCNMKDKCMNFKNNLSEYNDLSEVIPFKYKIVDKERHECIMKKRGLCMFPTEDCSNISGKMIKIDEKITTTDVRIIKWLTGYTVIADFEELPYMSKKWITNKNMFKEKKNAN